MLENFIKNQREIYPFHMPGHKRNKEFFRDFDFLGMDITEIEGADNLREATGVIKKIEEDFAKIYSSDKTFVSVNGSSGAILASVLYVAGNAGKILVARNCHISTYSGMVLSGAKPIYLMPEITDLFTAGGIGYKNLEKIISENLDIKGIFITSPTFEGFVSDIEKIANIAHKYDKILVVDEAHGAHLGFHEAFPKSAISCGADIVIQSLHKTMPVLNQTSLIHIKGPRVKGNILKNFLNHIQTTSPSYIFISAAERCAKLLLEQKNRIFDRYFKLLENFYESSRSLKNFQLLDKTIVGKYEIYDYDISKLVFKIDKGNPKDICAVFLKNYKIEMEMSSFNYFLAMTSIADKEEGFLLLKKALLELDNKIESLESLDYHDDLVKYPSSKSYVLSPREAEFSEKELVELENSEGKTAGSFIIPYPPGIPIIVPGEKITKDTINTIKNYQKNKMTIQGLDALKISVVK